MSLEQKRQISCLLPRQVVSHPEPPCASRSPALTATGTWSRDPVQTPSAPRRANPLNSPSASAAEGAVVSSTAQRFSVLLKVMDHRLNCRQTPFPLANKELLVFGKGLNGPERRHAGFKASAGAQLRPGGGAGWAPGSSPPGGLEPQNSYFSGRTPASPAR